MKNQIVTEIRNVMYEQIKNYQINFFIQEIKNNDDIKTADIRALERTTQNLEQATQNLSDTQKTLLANIEKNLTKKEKAMLAKIKNNEIIGDWVGIENKDTKKIGFFFTGKFSAFDDALDEFNKDPSDTKMEDLCFVATTILNDYRFPLVDQVKQILNKYREATKVLIPQGPRKNHRYIKLFESVNKLTIENSNRVYELDVKFVHDMEQHIMLYVNYHIDFDIYVFTDGLSAYSKNRGILKDKFIQDLTNILHIPNDKTDLVKSSQEYKHFIDLCCILSERMIFDQHKEKIKYANNPNLVISIAEFFEKIWKSLCELVHYFGLLPEEIQISSLKDSGKDWMKFVIDKGEKLGKKYNLIFT